MSSRVRISIYRHSSERKNNPLMHDSKNLEIPGHLTIVSGEGGLPKVVIQTLSSTAEIYLHGAHITRFQKNGEEPLLFMSAASEFAETRPIRGGVPIIFPWFGGRDGFPAHGFARTTAWELTETGLLPDGAVKLHFQLPRAEGLEVGFTVIVADYLSMELRVSNTTNQEAAFETCLHTYFQISAIDAISITGLSGAFYQDKITNATATETSDALSIRREVDRIYSDRSTAVEIEDPGFNRKIRIAKSGSNSTVVWNPWIDKSIRMPDFGDTEYLQMVCVESGNVAADKVILPPGRHAVLKVEVSSGKWPS